MLAIPIVGIVASSLTVILVVFFVTRARQRRVEAQIEMQGRLIDRFGSAPELITFLQSPAGRQFVAGVQSAPGVLTRERILSGFTRAIILTMLGVAFLFIRFFDGDRDYMFPAAILFCLGLGYFLATYISYRMSAKLLANEDDGLGTGEAARS